VELLKVHFAKQEALVSHANAALTPRARLRVARLVVEQGVPIAEVAARFQCSWPTVKRWAARYAAGEGMADRSSRPHAMPAKTCPATTKRIVSLRLRKRLGPVQLAAHVGVAPSTVHRVLRRCRLNRLAHVDRATGEPVRRYEHAHPGAMLHVDVKKYGNIPDGGGWRYVGRLRGDRNRSATPGKPKNAHYNPKMGHAFVHTAIDDHSRMAYAEIHDDETAATATGVLRRAVAWFAARDVAVQRVLSDNGSAYRSHLWRDVCAELGISTPAPGPTGHRRTARSNASTAPCPTGGDTPAATPQRPNVDRLCQHGSTSTTTTGPTPPAGRSHPSPA
jgi:transposase-like protein